jgi:uncharacterized membrane protein YdjX (TVP38/TMEM64 family)
MANRDGCRLGSTALGPDAAFAQLNLTDHAGLSRVSWVTFIWTTGVGILPVTILMVLVGDNVESMRWEVWLLLAARGAVFWLVARRAGPYFSSLTSHNRY